MTENMIFGDCVIFRRLASHFFGKMEVVIELRRSKNLGLGVFVVVEAAVYLTGKFVRNLRGQNETLNKLERPK